MALDVPFIFSSLITHGNAAACMCGCTFLANEFTAALFIPDSCMLPS
jgi:hypothetical protein